MNPLAHFFFGAIVGCCLILFGIEIPRRREEENHEISSYRVATVVSTLSFLAVFPQITRFYGDGKLDTGPLLNLFLFHDVLNLLGQKFRLGNGLLDPPVTVSALALSVCVIAMVYLRCPSRKGWNAAWRDLVYFSIVILCLVGVRSAVSGSQYVFMPDKEVFVQGNSYIVKGNTVFDSPGYETVVGKTRDKAIAVRDAYREAVNLDSPPEGVESEFAAFINYPSTYNGLTELIYIMQSEGINDPEAIKIIKAGTLPQRDLPLVMGIGIPLVCLLFCTFLLWPWLDF